MVAVEIRKTAPTRVANTNRSVYERARLFATSDLVGGGWPR